MDRCFAAFIVTNPQIEGVDFDHLRLQKNPPRRGYRSFHHRVPVQPEQPHPPSHCQRPPLKNREVEREPGLPSHREGRASNRTRQSAGRHRRPPSPSPKEILEDCSNCIWQNGSCVHPEVPGLAINSIFSVSLL